MAGLGPDPKAHRRFQEQTGRRQQAAHRAPDLSQSAKRLGLDVLSQDDDGRMHLSGAVHTGVRVDLYRSPPLDLEDDRRWPWRLEIRPRGLDPQISLRSPESSAGLLGKLIGFGRGVLTGDDLFDEVVLVSGPAHDLLAALSAPMREQIAWLCRRGGFVADGAMIRQITLKRMPRSLLGHARSMAVVASRLTLSPEDRQRALLRNAVHDPAGGLRARALEALLKLDGGRFEPAILQALTAAAHSDHPDLLAQGREGLQAAYSGGHLTLETCDEPCLLALLPSLSGATVDQVISRLAESGTQRAVPALVNIERSFFKGRARRALARDALAQIVARTGAIKAGGLTVVEDLDPGRLSLIPAPEASLGATLED